MTLDWSSMGYSITKSLDESSWSSMGYSITKSLDISSWLSMGYSKYWLSFTCDYQSVFILLD